MSSVTTTVLKTTQPNSTDGWYILRGAMAIGVLFNRDYYHALKKRAKEFQFDFTYFTMPKGYGLIVGFDNLLIVKNKIQAAWSDPINLISFLQNCHDFQKDVHGDFLIPDQYYWVMVGDNKLIAQFGGYDSGGTTHWFYTDGERIQLPVKALRICL